jgi:hypothetical protein
MERSELQVRAMSRLVRMLNELYGCNAGTCTEQTHAAAKLDPDSFFVHPVDWPEAKMILWECPLCHSSCAVHYSLRGAA